MPITADRQKRRSLATAASTGDRPPSSETPKRRYQSTPPRRDATMTTLLPRVSPGTRRGERKGSPDALQEGPAAPSGATASVSAKPTGISPDPILHLRHSGARHQTDHHPAPTRTRSFPRCLTTAPRRWSAQRRRGAGTRAAAPSAYGRAPPPPSTTVADRTP